MLFSLIARILFMMAHISFAITMTIFTRNAITGFMFGLIIPNIPQILEMILHFLKVNIELNFLKISALCHSWGVKQFTIECRRITNNAAKLKEDILVLDNALTVPVTY